MKVAIVNSSELGARWDAGFHLLRTELASLASELEKQLSPSEVEERVLALNASAWASLAPLSRQQNPTMNKEHVCALVRDYPYLAMAAILRDLPEHLAQAQHKVDVALQAVRDLEGFAPQINGIIQRQRPQGG